MVPSLCLLPVWGRWLFLGALLPNLLTLARTNLISLVFLSIARGLGPLRWLLLAGALAGAAYVVLQHKQLNFVATTVSLVIFTMVFLVVESATCLKKG